MKRRMELGLRFKWDLQRSEISTDGSSALTVILSEAKDLVICCKNDYGIWKSTGKSIEEN